VLTTPENQILLMLEFAWALRPRQRSDEPDIRLAISTRSADAKTTEVKPLREHTGDGQRVQTIQYQPIGQIVSPFRDHVGVSRQAAGALDTGARIEVFERFAMGLKDLDGFSHIVVVFHFHLVTNPSLTARPPWDGRDHGVFATRSPYRPNPIGVSIVRLDGVEGRALQIAGVDMIDGTPVLDIKPYIPDLNPTGSVKVGWLADRTEGMIGSRSGDR